MLDEVIITETPPLYCCYGRRGQQVCVPITGNRAKRIVHGALNVKTGELLLLITEVWDEVTHQFFLEMIRRHWRGWRIILFEDRGTPHTAARELGLSQSSRFSGAIIAARLPGVECDGSSVSLREKSRFGQPADVFDR